MARPEPEQDPCGVVPVIRDEAIAEGLNRLDVPLDESSLER